MKKRMPYSPMIGIIFAVFLLAMVGRTPADVVFNTGFEYGGGEPVVNLDAAAINGADGQVGTFSGTIPVGEGSGHGGTNTVSFQNGRVDRVMMIDRANTAGTMTMTMSSGVELDGATVAFEVGSRRTQNSTHNKDYQFVGLDSSGVTNFHVQISTRNDGATAKKVAVVSNVTTVTYDLPTVSGADATDDMPNVGNPAFTDADHSRITLMLTTNGYVIGFHRTDARIYTTTTLHYNGSATNLASIEIRYNGGGTSVSSGFFVDNIHVEGSLPPGPPAFGNPGDIAIYRAATAGETITNNVFDHTFDTTVRDTGSHEMAAGNTNVTCQAGHHLVMYSARFDSSSGSNRSELQSQIRVNGADIAYGWSQGYIRRSNGANECVTAGGTIINVPTNNTPVNLRSYRTDNNTGAQVIRYNNVANVQFLKMDDTWDYCRLSRSSDQTGPTTIYGWIPVEYNVQDELDTGSFDHVSGSSAIRLKQKGHYLVLANTYIFCSVDRAIFKHRLTLDGVEVPGSRSTVYIRGNQNSCQEGAATIGTIIETTELETVLNVESALDVARGSSAYKANRTGITVVKLPDDADYIRLDDSGRDNFNPAGVVALGWDTELERDTNSFTHADSQIGAAISNDYLFLTAMYDDNDSANDRQYYWQRWATNGVATPESFGQSGRFARDDAGSEAVGNWSGILLDLGVGDYVQTVCSRLAVAGTLSADFKGLQGVNLGTLFAATGSSATEPTMAVTSGLRLWLKADDGVQADPSNWVTNWVDQSGNGHDVLAPSLSRAPKIVSDVLNGKPVVRFNSAGTADLLERLEDGLGFAGSPGMTVINVLKASDSGNRRYFHVGPGEATNTAGRSIGFSSEASVRYNDGNAVYGNDSQSGSFSIGVWLNVPGSTHGEPRFFKDGVEASQTGSTNPTNLLDLVDGRTQVGCGRDAAGTGYSDIFDGDMAELLVFNRVLAQDEINDIGRYLSEKYGLDATAYDETLKPGDFTANMDIAFTGYEKSATLTDFPALMVLNEGVGGFSYADVESPFGYDLRFTDSTGTNVLFHEIDQWGETIPAPYAAWTFDDDTADDVSAVGGDQDGALNGSATFSTDTVSGSGKSLSLNAATTDFVQITGYKGIMAYGARTLSAWIKGPANNATIISWGTNVAGQKWILRVDNGNGAARLEVNAGYIIGSTVLTDGQWHHVAVVFRGAADAMDVELYVDGTRDVVSSGLDEIVNTVSGDDVKFGVGHNSIYYTGLMDDIAIWDVALNPVQVSGLYNRGNPPDLSGDMAAAAYAWVQIPSLTQGTTIKAYWGNTNLTDDFGYPAEEPVWDSEYLSVTHLDDGADATANGTHGAVVGARLVNGLVGGAINLDGANDYVNFGDVAALDAPSAVTMEVWFKRRTSNADADDGQHAVNDVLWSQGSSAENDNIEVGVQGGNVELYLDANTGDTTRSSEGGVENGRWHQLVFRYVSGWAVEAQVFVDGERAIGWDQWAGAWDSSVTSPLGLGVSRVGGANNGDFDGILDEARISTTGRSTDWIWASYQTVGNNDVFTEYGYTAPSVTPGDFNHKMKIVFDGYEGAGTLTDFPALVKLSETGTFKYSDFESPNGWDLRFTDAAGAALRFEIDEWDTGGTSYVWVRVPSLQANTAIWAYWGSSAFAHTNADPSSAYTWSDDYDVVWHLSEPNAEDSTYEQRDGTAAGNVSTNGLIGTGQEFTDDSLKQVLAKHYTAYTLSMWVKASTAGQPTDHSVFNSGDTGGDFQLGTDGTTPGSLLYKGDGGNASFGTGTVNVDEWVQLVVACDGTTTRAYYQGVEANSVAAAALIYGWHELGRNRGLTKYLNGVYDEFTVAEANRSADWVLASYQNVALADEFMSKKGMIHSDPATDVATVSATANGMLSWDDGLSTTVKLFWGTSDGGGSFGGWTTTNDLGVMVVGATNVALSGLAPDTTYYYRFYATNTAGEAWSDASVNFHTLLSDMSGLALWVNADAILGVTNGGTVDTWQDLSGNDNHLRRFAGDPLLVTNAVGGKPIVRFDGADNEYHAFNRISNIRTVLWVIKEDSGATSNAFLLGDSATYDFHRDTLTGTNFIWHASLSDTGIRRGLTQVNGTSVDGTATRMPTNMAIIALVTSSDVQANTFVSDRGITSRAWDGDVAEVMIFDRALSLGELNEVGNALSGKYGLATAYEDTTIDPGAFTNRMKVAFSGYSGGSTLVGFPVLVRLGEHISGFSYDGFASTNGLDIRFTDETGTNGLPFEIDEWNTNGYSTIWVQVPELTASAEVWAYWGNSVAATNTPYNYGEGVWDGDFDAVWHMREDLLDSTVNDIDGTGTNLTAAVGAVSSAREQDGVLSTIVLNDDPRLEHANGVTVEAWIKNDTATDVQRAFFKSPGYAFGINGTRLRFTTLTVKDYQTGTGAIAADTWHYIVGKLNANNNVKFYIDGPEYAEVTHSTPGNTGTGTAYLGRWNAERWDGVLDEMRVSGTTRSADWIQATYDTVANNDAFTAYQLFITADGASSIASTSADFEGTVHFTNAGPAAVTLYYGASDGGASLGGWDATNSSIGSKSGSFATNITGLTENATYYFRFYATNAAYHGWSGEQVFRTLIDDISGVALWLDADQIQGKGDGDSVNIWHDLSGNANHPVQLIGSMMPQYTASAWGGKPAVTFGHGETMPLPNDVTAQGATLFIIHRQDIFQGEWTSPLGGDLRTTQDDQEWSLERAGGGTIWIRPQITSTNFSVNVLQLVQNDYRMWMNGELIGTSTSGNSIQPFEEVGFDFEGDIAEVIVFNRALSMDEQNTIGMSLASKYGVSTGYERTTLNPALFSYKVPISYGYDKGDTLTNFPVYVELDSSVVGFNTNQFESLHGYDLRFTDDTQTNMLSFEVEQWLWSTPIAYYRFESNLVDSADGGRAYNGTMQGLDGGYTNDTPGGSGFALDISSTNGPYFDIAGWRGMGGKDARSITAWIKTSQTNAGIAAWGEDAGGQKWIFRVQDSNGTSGAIRVEINGGYVVGSTPVNDDAWHFVACVLPEGGSDSLDIRLYVDGQLEVESAILQQALDTDIVSGINMRFGNDHSNRRLGGFMDDVAIWDVALTDAQMAALYNGGTPEDIASGLGNGDTVYAWVQVPAFTNNSRIWAHWGNASETDVPIFGADGAAWNDDYEIVWHLNGAGMDSTANKLHGGANEGNPVRTNGIAYDGTGFDDSDGQDRITYTPSAMTVYNEYTVSVWAKALGIPDHVNRSVFNNGTANPDFQLDFSTTDASANYRLNADEGGDTHHFGPIAMSNWVHLVMTCDGTDTVLYYNGQQAGVPFTASNTEFNRFQVGANRNQDRHFPGLADEMHFMTADASSNWIWATYIMLASNDTYVTYGDTDGPAPAPRNDAPTLITDTNAIFNGYLSVTDDVPTHVWMFWGDNDGLDTWGTWDYTNDFGGGHVTGPLSTNIFGLTRLTKYYYAFFASNDFGTAWAQPSTNFWTLDVFFTITPSNSTYGTIMPSIAENVSQSSNSSVYTFHPTAGFHLTNVLVDSTLIGVTNQYQFINVQAAHGIQPLFGINMYTITVNQVAGGAITPDPANTVMHTNDSQVFTITPSNGYFLVDTIADGVRQGPVTLYQFLDVTTNHTITADYAQYPYANFPSNSLAFWIDADQLSLSDGDRLATWCDLSGHTQALHQADLPSRPEYITNALNGKPIVRFDGSYRMTTDVVHVEWPMTNASIFVVMKSDPVSQDNRVFSLYPEQSTNRFLAHVPWGNRTTFDFGNFSTSGRVQTAAFTPGTNYALWAMHSEYAVGQSIHLNGAIEAQDSTSDDISIDGRHLDVGTASYQGDMAEMLIFSEKLDFADQQRVGYYLQTKYGFAGSYQDPSEVNIGLVATTDADYPAPGVDQVVVSIIATNAGPGDATGVTVTNTLPSGLTYVSDDGGAAYNGASGIWTIDNLAYQGVATLAITCSLDSGTGDQVLTNTCAVLAVSETDWEAGNDMASAVFRANHETIVPSQFLRKMKITFPGYTKSETLTNFPALVKLNETLPGFRYTDFASGTGGDLRFTASDGQTALGYELEEWNVSGTTYVWVRIPGLAVGTSIYAYWGNPSDTTAPAYATNGLAWRADQFIMTHMHNGSGANSTTNTVDGGVSNAVADTGMVAGGLSFDGNDDYVNYGDFDQMDSPRTFTASLWFRRRTEGGDSAHSINNVLVSLGSDFDNDNLEIGTSTTNIEFYIDDQGADGNPDSIPGGILDDTWQYVALSYDAARSNEALWYVDGELVSAFDTASNGTGLQDGELSPFCLGMSRATTTATGDFDGLMDEFRIGLVQRSSNWIWACYNNMNSATYGTFVGFDEAVGPPLIENRQAIDISRTQGTMRGYLTATGGAPTSVWLYWGETDGLGDRTVWSNTNGPAANQVVGLITNRFTTLQPSSTYQYRYFASNTYGMAWAIPTTNFPTAASNEYAITAFAGPDGSVVPSGTAFVTGGNDSVTYNFSADLGYQITNVFLDGSSLGTPTSHQILNVQTDHTLAVYFGLLNFDVAITQTVGGAISPDPHGTIPYGSTSQVFSVTADAGYHLWDVIADGVSQGQVYSYQFTNVTNDHSITTEFRANPGLTVTNGAVLWLSAETLNVTNGANIFEWRDMTTNAHHVAQSDPGLAPTLVTNALNGKPAVYFDRPSGEYMRRGDALGFSGDPAMSVVCVATGPDGNTYSYIQLGDVGGAAGKMITFCTDAAVRYNNGNAQFYNDRQTGPHSIGLWRRRAGDEYQDPRFWKNGDEGTRSGQDNNPPNLAGLEDEDTVIGAGRSGSGIQNSLGGELVELIVYDRALNAADRKAIGRYLGVKYRIGTSYGTDLLPAGVDDPALYLAADLIEGATNNQPIASWEDLSGYYRNVVQGTAANQPLFKTNVFNGMPGVRFDGANDYLGRGDALGMTSDPAMTVVVICRDEKAFASEDERFLHMGDSDGQDTKTLGFSCDSSIRYNGGNIRWFDHRLRLKFHIGMFTRNSGDTYGSPLFYRDGVPATKTGESNPTKTLTGWSNEDTLVGTGRSNAGAVPSNPMQGEILEIIVYDRNMGAADRQAIGEYLMDKYKMRSSLFILK